MEFANKLRKLRKDRNLTMENLAEKLNENYGMNINKSTVSRWEKGSEPSGKTLYYLSDFFETTPAYLLDLPEESFVVPTNRKLPIVSDVHCGSGVVAFKDILGYEFTPDDWLNGGDYFYFRAKGDSMIGARINDGDLVLIRRQADFENGEIMCVNVNGETLLKRLFKQNDQIILQSENSSYQPRIINKSDDFHVIGKLKRVVIKY
ncbi:XRE family transcriptional regulator [Staphylococcus sp. 10602379]|uniref:helix-turn-helix domain-containing protein n=1 Tax=Staphylococcus sp. 10602379 TaxID=2714545 RepID=UPI001403C8A0|nr:XRE family transcriptional regulator [Staphylococcus sp. 10602379]NHM92931.1 helix-turn-helix domain-containing protein [Staphylococcus sp. 10602379]